MYAFFVCKIQLRSQLENTPLICAATAAAKCAYIDCVSLLLERGADKDAKDDVRARHFVFPPSYFCMLKPKSF